MRMVQFILARWSKIKSKGRDSTYSILVIFTLEIGLRISWKAMELTSLHQEKFIKDSSRKDLKRVMEGAFILMGSLMKAFGAKIIKLGLERLNFQTKSYLLGFLSRIVLRHKGFSWVQSEKMETLYGKTKESSSTIIGRRTLCLRAKQRRRS